MSRDVCARQCGRDATCVAYYTSVAGKVALRLCDTCGKQLKRAEGRRVKITIGRGGGS